MHEPCDEHACADERVEDVHILVGESFAEMLAGYGVGGVQNPIHHLHGGVDDAQCLGLFGESDFEEAFVKLGDDLLFTLCAVDFRGADPHGVVELLQVVGFGFQSAAAEGVHHALHDLGHGVVGGEIVSFEQGVEDGFGDQVLGQHADRVSFADGIVEVVAQPFQEPFELLGGLLVSLVEDDFDAGDERSGDTCNVVCPVLPVGTFAHLVHDAGEDGLTPLRQ
ncbi:Uncharacterised protein [Mycobacteroides abscessus subsp. massiliense]|nr:Uncharacterised protein [Mycobacteroides abscessus subsp. massiliense]